MIRPEIDRQEGTEKIERTERQQCEVVDALNPPGIRIGSHFVTARHHTGHDREQEGDPHLHCHGKRHRNADRHPGGDSKGSPDNGTDNHVRRLGPGQRRESHPDQFQCPAGQDPGIEITEDQTNHRPQHHRTVNVGEPVKQIQSGNKGYQPESDSL
ncbi:Uncharacterised protein [Klebsiella pneumoniae]|nr:Uncharacterised protein [Klebsiella pneumoniae]